MLVEGLTERAFATALVKPYLADRGVHLTTLVVATSRAASGNKRLGGGSWKHYDKDLRHLLGGTHWRVVTTMLDFYGYPQDAPGHLCARPHAPRECARFRENAIDASLADPRLRSFVMLHEFETLVFAASLNRRSLLGSDELAAALQAQAREVDDDVELINDSPTTAPSKRIATAWPPYEKVTDGVAAIQEAGLEAIRRVCPRFSQWLDTLSSDQHE